MQKSRPLLENQLALYTFDCRFRFASSIVDAYRHKFAIVEMEKGYHKYSITMISPRAIGVKQIIKLYPPISDCNPAYLDTLIEILEILKKLNSDPLTRLYYKFQDLENSKCSKE